MRYTWRQWHSWACMLGCLVFGASGCSWKPTPEEFGRQFEESYQSHYFDPIRDSIPHCEGSAGDRDWDYVCVVSWERPFIPPQRTGFIIQDYYKGKPLWSEYPLPNEGPVLSREEAVAWKQKRAAESEPNRRPAHATRR